MWWRLFDRGLYEYFSSVSMRSRGFCSGVRTLNYFVVGWPVPCSSTVSSPIWFPSMSTITITVIPYMKWVHGHLGSSHYGPIPLQSLIFFLKSVVLRFCPVLCWPRAVGCEWVGDRQNKIGSAVTHEEVLHKILKRTLMHYKKWAWLCEKGYPSPPPHPVWVFWMVLCSSLQSHPQLERPSG